MRSKGEEFFIYKLPPVIALRVFDATAKRRAWARAAGFPHQSRAVVSRVVHNIGFRTVSLLVHAQLAASVRIKSATLPTDAGE